jgi:hypothetical protein
MALRSWAQGHTLPGTWAQSERCFQTLSFVIPANAGPQFQYNRLGLRVRGDDELGNGRRRHPFRAHIRPPARDAEGAWIELTMRKSRGECASDMGL